jgi:polyhydroxyalkanoate synthesis regulator phasin
MKMSRKTKIVAGGIVALTLAITLGAAGAIAASSILSASDESQAVIDDAAKQLGVTPNALEDALKEALKNRVDDAVDAGRLTEEQGKALKERIDAGETPLVFGGFGRWGFGHFDHFGLGHLGHLGRLEAAASYLDVTESELRERLRDGDTLAEVAKAEGKSVDGLVKALVAAATEKIDDAVADGHLTKEHAMELKQGLEERITELVKGELRFRFRGFERGDFGFRFHDWPRVVFHGPRA